MTFVALEDAYGLYVVTGKALMTRAVGWIECRWGWRYSTIEDDGQALDGPITKSRLAEWFPEYTPVIRGLYLRRAVPRTQRRVGAPTDLLHPHRSVNS
jgi:hypothetical protein